MARPLIRPLVASDLDKLLEIESQSFAYPNWDRQAFLRYRCLVAEVGGEMAGAVVSRQTFAGNKEAPQEVEILNLAVAPQFRRQGIGSALLASELTRGGLYFLEVRESNRGAQALYRKLGFLEVSRRPGYYTNPEEAAIVMQMKKC